MSTAPIGHPLPATTPRAREADNGDGFFAHHGLWAPGVRLFRRLSFMAKAAVISLAFVLPSGAMVGWLMKDQADEALQARADAVRQHVEVAHGVLAWAQAQETAGLLTRQQAQAAARDAVAKMRYDGNEYFWINDMTPRVVMHPIKPELDGQDVGHVKDPNGLALFAAFVDTVRTQGKGYVAYQWPKPGQQASADKLSYVQGFEPWGWVIGSGTYVDDLHQQLLRKLAGLAAVVLAASAVACYLFLSFYRVIEGGLNETRRHLRAMTEGDLTTSPSPWGKDEAAQLMFDLRDMQASLRTMVHSVRRSSDDIVHASSEVASGAMDLSARTESAAASLQQSAASMEQIASTVKSTSAHTDEAARMAQHNAETATAGGRVMGQVMQTMEGIRDSSARIGEIIGTIDGIAFQTNILALNAAVEAARAGEQGRGFAVVAGEVRTLAQRSAEAARQIKVLIGTSVGQVESGVAVVRGAGAAIDDIVATSHRVNQLLGEVATGAREQTLGIGQIGQAVQDLDRVTQQNAALVEQTASASTAMRDQARALAQEVARFRLPEGTTGSDTVGPTVDLARFDFDSAIGAHRDWKVKLRKAIAHREQLDAGRICRDDACPLGQWIHGPGGQVHGRRKLFTELLAKHAEFHQTAGAVARTINAGRLDDAERLIGSGSDFARVSNEVCTLLVNAKRGLA